MLESVIKSVGEVAIKQAPKIGSFAVKHAPKAAGAVTKHLPKLGMVALSQAPKLISKAVDNPWGLKPSSWNARILICAVAGVIKTSSKEIMQAALLLLEWVKEGKVPLKTVHKIIRQVIESTPNISEAAMVIFKQILEMKSWYTI